MLGAKGEGQSALCQPEASFFFEYTRGRMLLLLLALGICFCLLLASASAVMSLVMCYT